MKKNEKHLSLRRFDYVPRYDDQSMNWLLLSLGRQCIAEFESINGPVELPADQED